MDAMEKIILLVYMVLMTIVTIGLFSMQCDANANISDLRKSTALKKKKKKNKQKNQLHDKVGLYDKVNNDTGNAEYIGFKSYKDCAKWIEKMVTGSNTVKIVNLYNYDDYYKEG